ncbi:2-keto-4-pentenoate hydratase [Acinetobacter sp. ANC 5383]
MMQQATIHSHAEQLRLAAQNMLTCPPLRESSTLQGDDRIQLAYAIQQHNIQQQLSQGARIVGRKIGLTSRSVQQQLGVDSPDYGCLFAHMAYADNDEIQIQNLLQPKIEAEIALVLKQDLTHQQHTLADILSATDYAVAALEIVDSRIQNWDISLVDTIADNASCGLFVLGSQPKPLSEVDLINCNMQLFENDIPVSHGQGKACLGNPLIAACWLADRMVELGTPLRAGDIVLTGALGPMVPAKAGATYHAIVEGLGQVRIHFTQ